MAAVRPLLPEASLQGEAWQGTTGPPQPIWQQVPLCQVNREPAAVLADSNSKRISPNFSSLQRAIQVFALISNCVQVF